LPARDGPFGRTRINRGQEVHRVIGFLPRKNRAIVEDGTTGLKVRQPFRITEQVLERFGLPVMPADFLSIQVTAFVLIVHHASETTLAMRSETSLRCGPSDAAQASAAASEDTGDASLEAFVQAFIMEEVSVPVGEGGKSVYRWDQILRHGQIMQTFVRISNA
jgi:hypothetical protein